MTYRFAEHVGEVEVELEAAEKAGVFGAALAAFADLIGGEQRGEPASREVEVAARDDALLLADWLSELVFLAEVDGFVPEHVVRLELGEGRLRATVAGRRGRPRHLVKAVTLNGLSLEERGGSWHGHVVLDV